mmetsp:Transcript_16642/g.48269  ORF Transcript_16642/g.48269 Transcript_16642/m.48269 type:complete len:245 (-) Transcript_16642:197-931(-)
MVVCMQFYRSVLVLLGAVCSVVRAPRDIFQRSASSVGLHSHYARHHHHNHCELRNRALGDARDGAGSGCTGHEGNEGDAHDDDIPRAPLHVDWDVVRDEDHPLGSSVVGDVDLLLGDLRRTLHPAGRRRLGARGLLGAAPLRPVPADIRVCRDGHADFGAAVHHGRGLGRPCHADDGEAAGDGAVLYPGAREHDFGGLELVHGRGVGAGHGSESGDFTPGGPEERRKLSGRESPLVHHLPGAGH